MSVGGKTKQGRKDPAYFASVRRHDEERLDVVLLQEAVPLVPEAWLHLVVSVQTLQGGPRDVHLAESETGKSLRGSSINSFNNNISSKC